MKLLFCPVCFDVLRLVPHVWRKCECGKSGGQYNRDGMTATLGGCARVFGVGNPFFDPMYLYLEGKSKEEYHKDAFKQNTAAWWGEYPGDRQIFRISSPDGPVLKVKIKPVSPTENDVTVVDERGAWIQDWKGKGPYMPNTTHIYCAGDPGRITVRVPSNPKPSWKGKKKE